MWSCSRRNACGRADLLVRQNGADVHTAARQRRPAILGFNDRGSDAGGISTCVYFLLAGVWSAHSAPWRRLFEADDDLARFRIAEICPGHAFDCLGIAARGFDRGAEQVSALLLGLDFGFLLQQVLSQPFVLINQRQIPDGHANDTEDKQAKDCQLGQLIPNAEVDVHARE